MTTASETGIYPFNEAWVPGSKMGLAVSERPDGGSFYEVLENMLLDIDVLVEGVYRDRIDRQNFHKQFVQYGILLYLMVMLVQYLLGIDTYLDLLENSLVNFALHAIVIFNSYFLLNGEKYYNENVGAE